MSLAFVITSIQDPTVGVRAIAAHALESGALLLVVGDKKSPEPWNCPGAQFLSYEDQLSLDFALGQHVPANSYARKMLGYLTAMSSGSRWIRETDDDNAPYEKFFDAAPDSLTCNIAGSTSGWFNAYTHFTDRFVWPRGYPLSVVGASGPEDSTKEVQEVRAPFILQAVADGDPDVDAIYRLTAPDTSDITFAGNRPLALPAGVWCPFNSQATTWPRELFALMYLPVTCTFRMTDIWRSFVVQRLLPGLGATLVFTEATVHQDRNEHDLLADFVQEVPGYLGTERIRAVLDATEIQGGTASVLSDLRALYEALVHGGFLTSAELPVLDAWIADVRRLGLCN